MLQLQMVSIVDAVIMLIEDEPLNVVLTRTMLGIVGVRSENVFTCATGRAAIQQLESTPVDLVLLDIQLPEENGYAVLEKLKARPNLVDVPIVAMTAFVTTRDVQQIEQAGFDGFIGKPLNFDKFPNQIRALLRGERVWDTH